MLFGWEYLNDEDVRKIEQGIVEGRALGGPWHIELQPTNLCNVDCFFCISRGGRHGESLDWPFLRGFLEENRRQDLRMLRLTGGGDPLSYPHIEALADACAELEIDLENIHTNGTRLKKLAERLTRGRLRTMTISLNATDPERYARMMRTSARRFDDAIAGTRAMVAARDALAENRRPKIWLQFFLWKESASDIRRMYEIGRALDVDTIFIRTIFGEWGHPKLDAAERPMIEEQLREIIREDAAAGEFRLHFELSNELDLQHFSYREQRAAGTPFSALFPDFRRQRKTRTEYCYVGWYSTSINARGEVFPCFQYHDMKNKQVGNIHEAPLAAVWRGKGYAGFREQIRELIRLNGKMEASDRFNRFIEHKCAECDGCQFSYKLAGEELYERVGRRIARQIGPGQRLRARTRDAALRAAHRLLNRPR